MNTDATIAPWRQFKVQLRKTWSELTDEDLDMIAEDSDNLVHVVQQRYGAPHDETISLSQIVERPTPAARCLSETFRLPHGKRHRIKLMPRITVCSSLSMLKRYRTVGLDLMSLWMQQEDFPIETTEFPS